MRRYEAIQKIMEAVDDQIVVCNLGHPSQELYMIKDRPKNFYMLGSMGLASSVGLGIAMAIHKKVIVLDGDGSILMNLGSLATVGANQPKNYMLVIIDNESYGSTGFQPTFTSKGLNLAQVAEGCNIKETIVITKEETIKKEMARMLKSDNGPYCVVIKTLKGMPHNLSIVPYDPIIIRNRFMRNI